MGYMSNTVVYLYNELKLNEKIQPTYHNHKDLLA